MNFSLILACLWVVVATATGMFPSKHHHWPQAYVLIAIGIPLLGYVTYENGPAAGVLVFAAGASILRWPLIYLWRWARRQVGGGAARAMKAAENRQDR